MHKLSSEFAQYVKSEILSRIRKGFCVFVKSTYELVFSEDVKECLECVFTSKDVPHIHLLVEDKIIPSGIDYVVIGGKRKNVLFKDLFGLEIYGDVFMYQIGEENELGKEQ